MVIKTICRGLAALLAAGLFLAVTGPIGNNVGFVISQAVAAHHEKVTYSFSVVMRVQRVLAAKGYDPGPVDGLFGPRTAAALKAYQRDNGMPASGVLDDKTRRSLGLGS